KLDLRIASNVQPADPTRRTGPDFLDCSPVPRRNPLGGPPPCPPHRFVWLNSTSPARSQSAAHRGRQDLQWPVRAEDGTPLLRAEDAAPFFLMPTRPLTIHGDGTSK